ncbi:scavenger receptor class B member 1 isoform X1 [Aphis craccivora]|uniref:Scavenger receptor class B member 1 isoform X1 n=1 Tax=Aphis craccivora TaxID=307492 RepID=A0A6G0YPX1_APHCR|nr:scavenger receptor class B member 1 isoform X1 [Aphis craccivora]
MSPTARDPPPDVRETGSDADSSAADTSSSTAVCSDFRLPWPPAARSEQKALRRRENAARPTSARRRTASSAVRRKARWTSSPSPSPDRRRVRSRKKNALFILGRAAVTVVGRSRITWAQAERDPSKQQSATGQISPVNWVVTLKRLRNDALDSLEYTHHTS